MTPRDIEKLQAIGYKVEDPKNGIWTVRGHRFEGEEDYHLVSSEGEGWRDCKDDAQSPEGLKATMADKVRWLGSVTLGKHPDQGGRWFACLYFNVASANDCEGDSPEVAVDALFWKVP